MYYFNLCSNQEGKHLPAWEEGVITDARRHPIEAGAMPEDRVGQVAQSSQWRICESRNSRLLILVSIPGEVLS